MSDLTPEDMEFVRDYAERNAGYPIVGPVVDFINHHLAPPRIIRTVEELEALDPDTILVSKAWDNPMLTRNFRIDINYDPDYADDLPAVVIATGEQVRAARKALEKENL